MRYRLENGDLKANCGTMPVVIQTIAAAAKKNFTFDEAMLEGTKRWVRSL